MTVEMNYLAILVAALAYMLIGAIWYSPILFGKAWMKGIGKTKEQVAADFSPLNYAWALITAFVASYAIARILFWTGGGGWRDGLVLGLLVGVCIAGASLWVNDTFEARPRTLTIINLLFHIVGLSVAGVIIGLW